MAMDFRHLQADMLLSVSGTGFFAAKASAIGGTGGDGLTVERSKERTADLESQAKRLPTKD